MQTDRPRSYNSSDIAAILADLQSTVNDATSLNQWAQTAPVPVDKIMAGSDLTYVRLSAHDHEGSPVVLMMRDRVWQRAI